MPTHDVDIISMGCQLKISTRHIEHIVIILQQQQHYDDVGLTSNQNSNNENYKTSWEKKKKSRAERMLVSMNMERQLNVDTLIHVHWSID